jgi:hypothetical protein
MAKELDTAVDEAFRPDPCWMPGLSVLGEQIRTIVDDDHRIAEHAKTCAAASSLFFIGRVRGYPVAREGAQKFKEITYRHAEAYQTSELKHGPLALIDAAVPTIAIVPADELVTAIWLRCNRSWPGEAPSSSSPTTRSTSATSTSHGSPCPRTNPNSTPSC